MRQRRNFGGKFSRCFFTVIIIMETAPEMLAYPISLTIFGKSHFACCRDPGCCEQQPPRRSRRRSPRRSKHLPEQTQQYFCGVPEDFDNFVRDCLCVLPLDPLSPLAWLHGKFKDVHGHTFLEVTRLCPNEHPDKWCFSSHELPKTSAGF